MPSAGDHCATNKIYFTTVLGPFNGGMLCMETYKKSREKLLKQCGVQRNESWSLSL
jgi:hypothetical protein